MRKVGVGLEQGFLQSKKRRSMWGAPYGDSYPDVDDSQGFGAQERAIYRAAYPW